MVHRRNLCIHEYTLSASTDTSKATDGTKPVPTRKMSIDPQAAEALEKRLTQRPEKQELVERNILKGVQTRAALPSYVSDLSPDDKVAPSLQAARDKLQRSQLEVCSRHGASLHADSA